MHGRIATHKEQQWLDLLEQLPCLVCDLYHQHPDTPAEIHHLNGQTQPGAHLATIALCARHHRHKDNNKPPRWISRHGDGKAAFEKFYLPESDLLDIQKYMIDQHKARIV